MTIQRKVLNGEVPLVSPICGLGFFGGMMHVFDPVFGFSYGLTPIGKAAISSVGLFTVLSITATCSLFQALDSHCRFSQIWTSFLPWVLMAFGAAIAIVAACSNWLFHPSPEYSAMHAFRDSLRPYSLGCLLLVPMGHLAIIARYGWAESMKAVQQTGDPHRRPDAGWLQDSKPQRKT